MVHWPVFRLALGTSHAATWTDQSQQAARLWRRDGGGSQGGTKMVDYVVFLEPTDNDPVRAVESMRRLSGLLLGGDGSAFINHTDLFHVRSRPIVVSAESKRPGEDWTEACFQVIAWHAAQWALLQDQQRLQRERVQLERPPPTPSLPPFLPAIIVRGHDWYFAATTRQDDTTVGAQIFNPFPFSRC